LDQELINIGEAKVRSFTLEDMDIIFE